MTESLLSSSDAPAVGIVSLREGVKITGGWGVWSWHLLTDSEGHLPGGARLCHSEKSDVGYTLVCASVSVKRG